MGVLVVDRTEARAALLEVTGVLADMLRPLGNTAIPIPGSKWTVGEMGNHVAQACQLFVELAGGAVRRHGDMTVEGLAAANAEWLARDPERGGEKLAGAIVQLTREFLELVGTRPPGQLVTSPAGKMDMDTFVSYALAHAGMHACAIARALHKARPVTREHVKLMMPFFALAMENFVSTERTRNLTASFLLRLRGGPNVAVTFDKGAIRVAATPPRRVDCHISADPVQLFLVAMGLKKQWGPIATGRLMTWGTKPWLALQFVGFFAVP